MLHDKQQGNFNRLSPKHGALCFESKEPKEGYELIEGEVNGTAFSKYIKKFAAVDGMIAGIKWYDREQDGNRYRGLEIKMKDKGEIYFIDLPFEKRPYDTFTKVAENIDYSKPVEFVAWADKQDSRRTAFAVKQDGAFVQWKYTKDNMGECPNAEQFATGKWSFDRQRAWLLERIQNIVIPQVEALNTFDEPEPEYSGEEVAVKVTDKLVDDPLNRPPDMDEPPEYVDVNKETDVSIPF